MRAGGPRRSRAAASARRSAVPAPVTPRSPHPGQGMDRCPFPPAHARPETTVIPDSRSPSSSRERSGRAWNFHMKNGVLPSHRMAAQERHAPGSRRRSMRRSGSRCRRLGTQSSVPCLRPEHNIANHTCGRWPSPSAGFAHRGQRDEAVVAETIRVPTGPATCLRRSGTARTARLLRRTGLHPGNAGVRRGGSSGTTMPGVPLRAVAAVVDRIRLLRKRNVDRRATLGEPGLEGVIGRLVADALALELQR